MNLLNHLLDRAVELPAEYGDGLTSHLPMALHALQRLGAGDTRLAAFFESYAARFGSRREPAPAPRRLDDWAARRGDFGALGVLRGHFAAALADDGATAVLRNALPQLWPGVAAAAFHGPIRVAHAFEAGHAGELAAALAYWAARWQPVAAAGPTMPTLDFDDWFERFVQAGAGAPLDAFLISGRIAAATATDSFRVDAARLAAPPDAVAALARRAARLYAATGNFTVLHLVTAARAVRVLAAVDAPPAAALWPAVAAALLAAQVRGRGAPPQAPAGWPEVIAAAVASDDDHVVKLVQACVEHAAHDPDPVFLQAARRAVG
jgi:hypothetical protein